MTTTALPRTKADSKAKQKKLSIFASVKLTIVLFLLIGATILVGAWCPQEAQVGQQKVIDQFGEEMAFNLMKWGITDIFHTWWFLSLIGLLTVNIVVASVQRVFPKAKLYTRPMTWLGQKEITKLPINQQIEISVPPSQAVAILAKTLRACGYKVQIQENRIIAEAGKIGRLAATTTHIGLLTLLAGVTITSWTGFSGFQPVLVGSNLNFASSEHSKLWIGHLPKWQVRVDNSRKETYPTGEPKQWYSNLSVIDPDGKILKRAEISVNNPLTYEGVDVYQSSWGLDHIDISFGGHKLPLGLRPMGRVNAAFLPLDQNTILIFSVHDPEQTVKMFAKTINWPSPKLLAEIKPGGSAQLGAVKVGYERVVPISGLQYKCDPGLPITYVAFFFIISGVLLAAVPHRQVWAEVSELKEAERFQPETTNACILFLGGTSPKSKTSFAKSLTKIASNVASQGA